MTDKAAQQRGAQVAQEKPGGSSAPPESSGAAPATGVVETTTTTKERAPLDPKIFGVSMFKIVSETSYPRIQSSLPEAAQVNLYAYYQQATAGPCKDSPPNCILSFFSPPLTNVKWQTWKNLGNMSKAKAMRSFMELYADNDPDFQERANSSGRNPLDELRVQMVLQMKNLALKRRTDKFLFLYSKIARSVLKIQTIARMYIAKKAFLKKHSSVLQDEVGWLVDVLKLGIRVTKVAYNGGVPRTRFLWLEGDSFNLGNARLCVASKITKGSVTKTKGLFIADIAEIRANSSSYTFTLAGAKVDDNECLSIIGTERTVDLMFYKGEMYGKSRDWLVRTLNILVDKSVPSKELSSRGRVAGQRASGVAVRMSAGSLRDAEHMTSLLQKGFGVKEYIESSSSASLTTMWIVSSKGKPSRLVLSSSSPFYSSKGISVNDISEVRFGKVSNALDINFPERAKMVTVVGSETSLHLVFDDEVLRTKFVVRLQNFLLLQKKQ